jgi:hypothetical protein
MNKTICVLCMTDTAKRGGLCSNDRCKDCHALCTSPGHGRGQVVWRYRDNRGCAQVGRVAATHDKGGTDVTYQFRRADGTIDVVSGSRVREAKPLYGR